MSQESAVAAEATRPPMGRPSMGWVKLLRWATIAAAVVVIFINIVAGIIPPLLVFVLLWLGGLFWLRRATKGPAILLLVTFILFLLLSAPFIVPTLTVPESAGDFITNLLSVLAALVAIVSAIALLRKADERGGAAKKVGLAALAVAVVGVALSVVTTLGYEDATAQAGDVELVTEDIEFSETSIEAPEGEVSVFVDNADATLHTFTIDELDVDVAIPASKAARVSFQAPPGTYEFYCAPHKEDMKGTLTVE